MFKRWLPVKFFDEDGGAGSGTGNENNAGGNNGGNDNGAKTFTQEEVNAMLAKEKQQGKNSVLRALGLKTVDEGKAAIEAGKNAANKDKTAEEQAAETLAAEKTARTTAEQNLLAANRKIAVMQAGFNPQYVDDVVAIASGKVTDDKDFETVIEEMKKSHSFYLANADANNQQNKGTGKNAAGFKKGNNDDKTPYGQQLAKQRIDAQKKVNEYKFFG